MGGVGATPWSASPPQAVTPPAPAAPAGWGAPPPAWGQPPLDSTPAWGAPPPAADPRVAALETRCAELRRDVDTIALFAKTLLVLLEEKQVVTEQQFAETRARLDALATSKG